MPRARMLLCGIAASAVGFAGPAEDLFQTSILPALKRDCLGCHGEGQTLAGLDLRQREGLLRGGQRGPSVIPGNAGDSLLYQVLIGKGALSMPPGGEAKRLKPETLAAFKEWIDGGAPWADAGAVKWTYAPADLWALKPLSVSKGEHSIDSFIRSRLREKDLTPAPAADRRTLLRRVTFDLTGLPPAPAEIDAFVSDRSADAWEKVVDRLLASPRYGERWARHWLDIVRYADTNGYSNDFERPNAWRYRDYVIRSFNRDKPYNQFVREQIAGDEWKPGDVESLIATGFLRSGPWEHTAMSVEAVTRQMWLDDVAGAVGTVFLGMTTGCARCHDHKFDPIPTADYYRIQAAFASTEFARPAAPFLQTENTRDMEAGKARLQQSIEKTDARLAHFRTLAEERLRAKQSIPANQSLTPAENTAAMKELSAEEFEEFKLHQKHQQLYRESLDRYAAKAFAVSSGPMDGATDGGPNLKYSKRAEYTPADVNILAGGSLQAPGERVAPGVLAAPARYGGFPEAAIPTSTDGRRLALANWIANAENPLTARVIVNRVWQYHFGRGIAADTSNFGKMGAKPTHPELLDWLAQSFMEDGWSIKALHRKILMSETYRQAGGHPAMKIVIERDPANQLLAYFPPRRLEAEEIRDSILAVSGELSLEAGGPGALPQINEDVAQQPRHAMGSLQPAYFPSPEKRLRNRRTIYMFQQRSLADPAIEVFNGAGPDLSCERREASTVPTQAFTMLNSSFANDMALAMADRLVRESPSPAGALRRAFLLSYGRDATDEDIALGAAHLTKMTAFHRAHPAAGPAKQKPIVHTITSELTGEQFRFQQQERPPGYEENLHVSAVAPETRALADVLLGILNANEFVYVY